MSINTIENPQTYVHTLFYAEVDEKVIGMFAVERHQELPENPVGNCADWEGCLDSGATVSTTTPDKLTYRFADELAVKSYQAGHVRPDYLEGGLETFPGRYCEQANEYRVSPVIEITDIEGADGPSKLTTDIHRFITTQYSLPKNKKVKVSFDIKDIISGEVVDWDEELRFKVQILDEGIPEELSRGDIECKDGKGYFEFDAPTTKKKAFLKIKPPKEGYGEDGEFLGLHPDKFVCLLSFK